MTIRGKLVLAFLLLAAVPLTAIVLYSYGSSQRAFRLVVASESRGLAEEMQSRLEEVRSALHRRVQGLAALPLRVLQAPETDSAEASQVYADLVAQLGEAAELVESFEFVPVPGAAGPERPGAAQEDAGIVIYPSQALAEALRRLESRTGGDLDSVGLTDEYVAATIGQVIKARRQLEQGELDALTARDDAAKLVLGSDLRLPVRSGGEVIGYLSANVRAYPIVREVLAKAPVKPGDIAYARDDGGNLYVAAPEDRLQLEALGVAAGPRSESPEDRLWGGGGWIVAEPTLSGLGLSFGIARPVGGSLREIRAAAVRNFALGIGLLALAIVAIVPLSSRLTRNLGVLTTAAEQLGAGDLTVRVPVVSRDELGRLAETFNHMAGELAEQQGRLLEQGVRERLLEADNARKGRELEEARAFQVSLLPKSLPVNRQCLLGAYMRTAAEVGGDYYDFLERPDGGLVAVLGDATGHGARPGVMVSVTKGLFTLGAGTAGPAEFLAESNRAIKRMGLARMQMALTLVHVSAGRIVLAAAGMPPALLWRATDGAIEELALHGLPLGGLSDATYREVASDFHPGDTLLLHSDGLPELADGAGEPFGYERLQSEFAGVAAGTPASIVASLAAAGDRWREGLPLKDDMTFVVMRRR